MERNRLTTSSSGRSCKDGSAPTAAAAHSVTAGQGAIDERELEEHAEEFATYMGWVYPLCPHDYLILGEPVDADELRAAARTARRVATSIAATQRTATAPMRPDPERIVDAVLDVLEAASSECPYCGTRPWDVGDPPDDIEQQMSVPNGRARAARTRPGRIHPNRKPRLTKAAARRLRTSAGFHEAGHVVAAYHMGELEFDGAELMSLNSLRYDTPESVGITYLTCLPPSPIILEWLVAF
jgi:hypothetical protein